jgi:large subunit ribosomal protein L30
MSKKIKIKLMHSPAGGIPKHRKTVKGLGFRKLYEERDIVDTPAARGMVKEVSHLVSIIEESVDDSSKAGR